MSPAPGDYVYFKSQVPLHKIFVRSTYPSYSTLLFVNWTPSFLLKRYVLSGIRDGPHEPFIADSVDFVVGQV
ncbi:hypothetical protein B296_00023093 [Ensete ventricosum]|uniref:Uncharacterized protein n=1 Tax=Ensete ventricosum TaxID=4639 RepID=A0A426ZC33_ENSVE|nr:hypothetical protein B296_00023093 [Ensete ventricosum]